MENIQQNKYKIKSNPKNLFIRKIYRVYEKNKILGKIKSDFIIKKIFYNLIEKRKLAIIKYNLFLWKRNGIDIKTLKTYMETKSSIIYEVTFDKDDFNYYYELNDNLKYRKKLNKYKIAELSIDLNDSKYLNHEFNKDLKIKTITFTKFFRTNIVSMSEMF